MHLLSLLYLILYTRTHTHRKETLECIFLLSFFSLFVYFYQSLFHRMIECSKMIETHYLTSRKSRTPCDLPAIRSWIVTELGIDLSVFAIRSLLLFVSVFRTDKRSKKKGYCPLIPPRRNQYSMWCTVLIELVAKNNESKKTTTLPLLIRANSIKNSNNNITISRQNSKFSLSRQNSFPPPSSSLQAENNGSFLLLPAIDRCKSDPLVSSRAVASHDEADETQFQKEKEQRLHAFRAQNSSLIREQSRRNMLGTLDYTPCEITSPILAASSSSSTFSPVTTKNFSSCSSTSSSSAPSLVPFAPRPPVYVASLNDMTDTVLFGDASFHGHHSATG